MILSPLPNSKSGIDYPTMVLEDVLDRKWKFLPLYRFKYARLVSAVSRMKIALTALSVAFLPPYSYQMYLMNT